jgi:hypothetical protein
MLDSSFYREWRSMLADCWTAEAARNGDLLKAGDRAAVARSARQALVRADATVRNRIHRRGQSAREDLIAAAAEALEACAAVWQAFGPVAGARRLPLLRGLERQLAQHEARMLAGEIGHGIDRQAGATAARTARLAIEGLDDDAPDPAACLTALEASALAFAAIAIRAAENLAATDCAGGRPVWALRPRSHELQRSFAEIHAHAQTLLRSGYRSDAAGLLSECLVIASPSSPCDAETAAFLAPAAGHDDSRYRQRRRWLRLGARELLLCRELAALPGSEPGPESAEIVAAAARILADPGPASSASAAGAPLAWANQASALSRLVPVCARALRGDIDAAHVACRTLTDRLTRVVIMLWLVGAPPANRRHEPPADRNG